MIKAPVARFGTYGLFEESGAPGGSPGISNIDFSNRAFTPLSQSPPPPGAARPVGSLTGTTDISFDLGTQATVRIEIYNRTGRLERILEPGRSLGPGRHIITWDGLDHNNERVKSGLYIVVIDADGDKAHKTVAVVNNLVKVAIAAIAGGPRLAGLVLMPIVAGLAVGAVALVLLQ